MNACVACRSRSSGMIPIFQHPNGVDQMFSSVTGIDVESGDFLCIPCYDDLKIAHQFKQRTMQNNILRLVRNSPASAGVDKNLSSLSGGSGGTTRTVIHKSVAEREDLEVSTTYVADDGDFEEQLDASSDLLDDDEAFMSFLPDDDEDDVKAIKSEYQREQIAATSSSSYAARYSISDRVRRYLLSSKNKPTEQSELDNCYDCHTLNETFYLKK